MCFYSFNFFCNYITETPAKGICYFLLLETVTQRQHNWVNQDSGDDNSSQKAALIKHTLYNLGSCCPNLVFMLGVDS